MTGIVVLLAALAAAAVVAARDAVEERTLRAQCRTERERLTAEQIGVPLGDRATMVQFSSAFCSPCRATRVLLTDVASKVPGVVAVDIDAEEHLQLVRDLDIMRTPTVLILDAAGARDDARLGAPAPRTGAGGAGSRRHAAAIKACDAALAATM